MTGAEQPADRDPVDLLVEQFLAEHRGGAAVDVETFAAAHPEHAAALRELLPTLVALEQVRRDRATSTGSGKRRLAMPTLERLGDFRIVREVGRGGMGVVFEAVQESLDRHVALKVLPQASLLSGTQLRRFQREARVAAQLHHSHIVPVFGSGQSDGFHWYAMQFIDGQSLDHWRHQHAETPPADAAAWRERARFVARIGAEAASALQYAHEQGTLHRDIKPANLLLAHGDHVWVTDFGLAKALEAEGLTHSSDLLGTLQYMAPEQFAGHYDAQSEVYALGVTLYELLALRAAFAGRTRSELMQQIRTLRPTPLRRCCPDLAEDLIVIVERAMARDPRDRYRDAAALQQDLQAFLDDRPIAARRHNAAQLLLRWCRRNRTVAALAACTVLAVVAAGVTGWVAYGITVDALAQAKVSAQAADDRAREVEVALAQARRSAAVAAEQSELVASNLKLTLAAFGELFDALVGRDPALAVDEDPDTGEQTVVARTVVEPRDVELLQEMLQFYDRFATANESSQSLRFETARAHRRVGAIQARLGNLDAAATSYLEALSRFLLVEDRDVRRELAGVHVDYGQIEQRRGRPGEAVQRFRVALDLLGADDVADNRSLRFERAQAHFLIARRPGPGPAGGPNARAGAERPGGERPGGERPGDRVRAEAQQELSAAQAILADLLREEPQNPEFRALQARCLLESGRRSGRGEADRQAAITIFRQLVAEHPQAEQFTYELCEALWSDGRPFAPDDTSAIATAIERLGEAAEHAERLVAQQPNVLEYRGLRARVASSLGRQLLRAAAANPDRAEVLRHEAELELRAAMAIEDALAADDKVVDLRLALAAIGTRSALTLLLLDTGRVDAARAEAETLFGALRRLAAGTDGRRRLRGEQLDEAELVARRLARSDLAGELRRLRDRLPPEPEGPPPRRR